MFSTIAFVIKVVSGGVVITVVIVGNGVVVFVNKGLVALSDCFGKHKSETINVFRSKHFRKFRNKVEKWRSKKYGKNTLILICKVITVKVSVANDGRINTN